MLHFGNSLYEIGKPSNFKQLKMIKIEKFFCLNWNRFDFLIENIYCANGLCKELGIYRPSGWK